MFKFATEQLSKIGGWATRLFGNFQIQFGIADALDFCILDLWRRSFLWKCATWYLWLAHQHKSKKSIHMQLLFTGLLIHFCNFAQAFYPESSLHRPPMMQIDYQRRNHRFIIFQLWNKWKGKNKGDTIIIVVMLCLFHFYSSVKSILFSQWVAHNVKCQMSNIIRVCILG